jgi:hypothetical protein
MNVDRCALLLGFGLRRLIQQGQSSANGNRGSNIFQTHEPHKRRSTKDRSVNLHPVYFIFLILIKAYCPAAISYF